VPVFDPSTLSKPEGTEELAAAAPGVEVEGVKEDSAQEAVPYEESHLRERLAKALMTLRVNELVNGALSAFNSAVADELESDPESTEKPEQVDASLLMEAIV